MEDRSQLPEQQCRRKFRIELRIVVREIWEVEAADEIEAEFQYATNPDGFIFDREEIETTLVKVEEAPPR